MVESAGAYVLGGARRARACDLHRPHLPDLKALRKLWLWLGDGTDRAFDRNWARIQFTVRRRHWTYRVARTHLSLYSCRRFQTVRRLHDVICDRDPLAKLGVLIVDNFSCIPYCQAHVRASCGVVVGM